MLVRHTQDRFAEYQLLNVTYILPPIALVGALFYVIAPVYVANEKAKLEKQRKMQELQESLRRPTSDKSQ